jgi:hypothetical protein
MSNGGTPVSKRPGGDDEVRQSGDEASRMAGTARGPAVLLAEAVGQLVPLNARNEAWPAGKSSTISAVVSVDALLRIGLHEILQARSLDIVGPGREPADHHDEVSFHVTLYPDDSLFVTVGDACDLLKVYEACDRVARDLLRDNASMAIVYSRDPSEARRRVAAFDPETDTGWSNAEFTLHDEFRRFGI